MCGPFGPADDAREEGGNRGPSEVSSVGVVHSVVVPGAGLNYKGEVLAMIQVLAAGESESTRGMTAWCWLIRDHRRSRVQRVVGLVGQGDFVVVRSLVPENVEKDLLKIHPTSNCDQGVHP